MKRKTIPAGDGIILDIHYGEGTPGEGDVKEIHVAALTVDQIHSSIGSIFDSIQDGKKDSDMMMDIAAELLPKCTNLDLKQFKTLNNNVLVELYKAFREVNAGFFEISSSLGLTKMGQKMFDHITAIMEKAVEEIIQPHQPEQSPQSTEES